MKNTERGFKERGFKRPIELLSLAEAANMTDTLDYYNGLNPDITKAILVSIDKDKNIDFHRNGQEWSFILFDKDMTPKEMMDWLFHFSEKWESPYTTAALVEAFRIVYGYQVYAKEGGSK